MNYRILRVLILVIAVAAAPVLTSGCGTDGGQAESEQAPDAGTDSGDAADDDVVPTEVCDEVDNDGDDIIDEDCACAFEDLEEGVCAGSIISEDTGDCQEPEAFESDETLCDDLDNDCDGVVDEGCSCNFQDSDVGVCASAVLGDEDGRCAPPDDYEGEESSCDGVDNDCDGTSDEGCPCDYDDREQGVCAGSSIDEATGACGEPDDYESDETACDFVDNDCDGVVDEGCPCNYEGSSFGVCSNGLKTHSGDCLAPAEYEPDETLCDGLDNDCDNKVDEMPNFSEDFEGSASGWYAYTGGSGPVNINAQATDYAHAGSQSGKANGSTGACGEGGIARDFSFVGTPDSVTVWVRAETDNWGRVNIFLEDANGIHKLWEKKGSGSAVNMGWTEMTFDLSTYESDFTLIFGNGDDSQYCGNNDHTWAIWVDDLDIGQGCD